ncbi:MAG: UPF0755 protein [Myxococcota bacterium]|jgi:UPF0755 protein
MVRGFSRLRLLASLSVVGAVATLAGYGWFVWKMTTPADPAGGQIEVVIDRGTTFDSAAETLYYHGLIPDIQLFSLRARQQDKRGKLRAGLYVFDLKMTPDEVLDKLAGAPDAPIDKVPLKFQIIPGDNIWRIAERLHQLGIEESLLEFDADPAQVAALKVGPNPKPARAHTRLEGYLFPETYHLDRKNPSLTRALRAATSQFQREWRALKSKHAGRYASLRKKYKMTDHDFVTMASLVEKEVAALAEAPTVAKVFYNRFDTRMRLATDPTMVYGPDTWKSKPSPTFRRDKTHPYNTYHVRGLPPGPICSPSRHSLEAVLNPSHSDALYFVARRDGTGRHAFAKTLKQHKANIDTYLKGKR